MHSAVVGDGTAFVEQAETAPAEPAGLVVVGLPVQIRLQIHRIVELIVVEVVLCYNVNAQEPSPVACAYFVVSPPGFDSYAVISIKIDVVKETRNYLGACVLVGLGFMNCIIFDRRARSVSSSSGS